MAYLGTAISLVLLRLAVCEEAFRPSNSGVIAFGNFLLHKSNRLFAATLKEERVKSSHECLIRCVETHGCLSVNVNTSTSDDQGLSVCEVLASDKYKNQSNFRPSKGIDHYSIASPCEKKPCKYQGKCNPQYTNHTYKCECVTGTKGKDCEIRVCDEGWLPFENNCYFFNHDPKDRQTWNDAKQACQLLGGHLIDIRTEDEWYFVKSHLRPDLIDGYHTQYLIGMTDAASEGQWKYTDGSDVTFFKWKLTTNEPNGGTSENCGTVFSYTEHIGLYNDLSCTQGLGKFICKKGAAA